MFGEQACTGHRHARAGRHGMRHGRSAMPNARSMMEHARYTYTVARTNTRSAGYQAQDDPTHCFMNDIFFRYTRTRAETPESQDMKSDALAWVHKSQPWLAIPYDTRAAPAICRDTRRVASTARSRASHSIVICQICMLKSQSNMDTSDHSLVSSFCGTMITERHE